MSDWRRRTGYSLVVISGAAILIAALAAPGGSAPASSSAPTPASTHDHGRNQPPLVHRDLLEASDDSEEVKASKVLYEESDSSGTRWEVLLTVMNGGEMCLRAVASTAQGSPVGSTGVCGLPDNFVFDGNRITEQNARVALLPLTGGSLGHIPVAGGYEARTTAFGFATCDCKVRVTSESGETVGLKQFANGAFFFSLPGFVDFGSVAAVNSDGVVLAEQMTPPYRQGDERSQRMYETLRKMQGRG